MRRFLAWTAGILVVLAVLGVVGVGWYYSGEILDLDPPDPPAYETRVVAVEGDRVTLEADEESRQPGTWGIDAPEAYGQVGEILDRTQAEVTREYTPLSGELLTGDVVDVDGYAYPQDPEGAFNFDVRRVTVATPLGDQPAWLAEGTSSRWAIVVHGRGARLNECFRILPILHDLNLPTLCPSYRNDEGGPTDPDRIYRQGDTEWEDVEAAVRYAVDEGAKDIVMVGLSMGGQVTANFLRRSDLADQVVGVIWDAPLLDWGPVIGAGAVERGVPQWLVPIGMQASEWEAGVDYDELNQIVHADEFEHPILLFHGDADATVPVSVSDRFADARPDLVTYVRVEDAGHVRSWNADPAGYQRAVRRFVSRLP